ncbi:MAG: HlyD family efflux transporter periplasmic adaptor subunit [Bacteroidales bacterium]|nr:HlyD family efflux transporter periplasmic adaptor subunit [Bacteroidales bacterium]
MNRIYFHYILALGILFISLTACNNNKNGADAYGNFEATNEVIISAEGNGKILEFNISEGEQLKSGDKLGVIDTTQLYLQKLQLQASIAALRVQAPNIPTQLKVIEDQLNATERERRRIENLVKSGAATTKQLDDINTSYNVLISQIDATRSSLSIQTQALLAQIDPLKEQIKLIDNMIEKSVIINPIDGVVLTKYAQQFEFTATGKPLYKIADLDKMTMRVYISEDQLSGIKIGDQCRVFIDAPNGALKEYSGVIAWVSDKSEFTPKMIQTKNERVNLVYAVKIEVINDGAIKIGMPGEVSFLK